MALTINQLKRERRNAYHLIKRATRKLDSKVELLQRQLNRVLNRKATIPDVKDIGDTNSFYNQANEALRGVDSAIDTAEKLFT